MHNEKKLHQLLGLMGILALKGGTGMPVKKGGGAPGNWGTGGIFGCCMGGNWGILGGKSPGGG